MPETSQDVDATRTFYTRISSVYDALADRHEYRARDVGLSLLAAGTGESILEIGFGTGSSIVALAAAVGETGHVYGVDISPGMKAVADDRIRAAKLTTPIDLEVTPVPPVPYGDAMFDAVFMAFTLELFPDATIPILLREVRRTLRTRGRLAVVRMALGSESDHRAVPELIYQWMHRHFPHIVDCRPIDPETWLGEAGFSVARSEQLEIWGLSVAAVLAHVP
jgi:demethylmenaquinone methyltransferase/2-methoxy-6-polyprenyl-1,4-benzoquinol methylase